MKIFVASLSYRVDEHDVKELFEQYGAVENVKVILDRETGKSRGFGFVEMAEDAQGALAISELNGAEFEGRKLVVKQSEERRN